MDLRELGGSLMTLAGGIFAIALLAAFVWEALKRVFPLRAHCHRHTLTDWFGSDQPSLNELHYLLGEQDISAMLNQPLPRLMAAIQGAATTVLEYPARHEQLYKFLTASKVASTDADVWRDFAVKRTARAEPAAPFLPSGARASENEAAAFIARDNLERLVNRKLDAVQARCELHWGRFNRQWILILGAWLVLLIGLVAIGSTASLRNWLLLIVSTVVTALMAVLAGETLRGLSDRSGN